jgi:hypothetical protein
MAASDNEKSRLDEAARAGWLYFIAGHTQDEIAKALKIGRASVCRLLAGRAVCDNRIDRGGAGDWQGQAEKRVRGSRRHRTGSAPPHVPDDDR